MSLWWRHLASKTWTQIASIQCRPLSSCYLPILSRYEAPHWLHAKHSSFEKPNIGALNWNGTYKNAVLKSTFFNKLIHIIDESATVTIFSSEKNKKLSEMDSFLKRRKKLTSFLSGFPRMTKRHSGERVALIMSCFSKCLTSRLYLHCTQRWSHYCLCK